MFWKIRNRRIHHIKSSKIIDKLDIDLIESDLSEIFSVDIFNKKILFNSQIEE